MYSYALYRVSSLSSVCSSFLFFFFFNDTATTEIYTLSLHDALPICFLNLIARNQIGGFFPRNVAVLLHVGFRGRCGHVRDRKSTRLNSSHANISYAVFCFEKKKERNIQSVSNTSLTRLLRYVGLEQS